ncbi:MAG TPA: sulfite exporter TauE/SafE family protein [Xanthobacteraceae bacterium]|nr:sulfite exporter TauE/SafE family protein [Xanthobacteraceae bacterium]
MIEFGPFLIISAGVFAGALVSGVAGFAFSGVAGAMLLHVLPPTEAVPFMMICSIAVQSASLVVLRRSMSWRGSRVLIIGGALGIPPALYLLQNVDVWTFRVGFGIFLAIYSAYMILRPAAARLAGDERPHHGAAVGFAGGLIGGLTAMPGALPTIWCDLRGVPKDQQRGLVQPFIAVMQIFALALLLVRHSMPIDVLRDAVLGLPALAAGTAIGLTLFGRMNDALFRRAILGVLFVAGLGLML